MKPLTVFPAATGRPQSRLYANEAERALRSLTAKQKRAISTYMLCQFGGRRQTKIRTYCHKELLLLTLANQNKLSLMVPNEDLVDHFCKILFFCFAQRKVVFFFIYMETNLITIKFNCLF